jgi:phosphoribosyl-ATP pyrophosphohydrolase
MNQVPSSGPTLGAAIDALAATIAERRGADPASSYTAQMLAAGRPRCARKFGEEAVETVVAALAEDRAALAAEAADALYHLLVLLAAAGTGPDEVAAILARRAGISGLQEKASRSDG